MYMSTSLYLTTKKAGIIYKTTNLLNKITLSLADAWQRERDILRGGRSNRSHFPETPYKISHRYIIRR